jgi:hypothetical protein
MEGNKFMENSWAFMLEVLHELPSYHKLKHGGTKFAENSWAFVLEKPRRSCEDTPFYGLSYAGKGVFATVTPHLFRKGL